jgi:colanic acid/amylovoran biosynthesis glycosyltransferase
VRGSGRLHVAEIGVTWPPETFVCWKLEGLVARGFDVTVATFTPASATNFHLPGVRVVRLPHWDEPTARMALGLLARTVEMALRSPRSLVAAIASTRHSVRERHAGRAMAFAQRLRRYLPLARLRPDVVHFEWNSAAVAYLPLARAWDCPTVVSCHGTDVNVRPHGSQGESWARWLRASFDRVSAVHCVSGALVGEAVALGADPRRTWLIRPGVDPSRFTRLTAESPGGSALRIVSVGHLRWVKGHEYALRALRRLLDQGIPARLDLVGGDPAGAVGEDSERPRIERAIDRLRLAGHVRVHGELESESVLERLRDADVLLHTSVSEGIPVAMLEAMSCALPVVATACGGIPEAVADGVEGFVVPLRDSDALAGALRALYENPDLRRVMGAAGRARVEAEFALEDQLNAFASMYETVIAGDSAPPLDVPTPPTDRPPAVAGQELRLISAAPLSWGAGHDDAMQAVALLRARGIDCRLRIAGEGPYRDALLFARRQLGLEGVVDFVGADEDHADWADIVVDASLAAAPAGAGDTVAIAGEPAALAEAVAARVRAFAPA